MFARKLMRDREVGRGTLERERERRKTQEARTGTAMSVYTVS